MTPEEQLDRLIDHWERGTSLELAVSHEVEARLVVAATLIQMQALEVPPAFAARLEARVRARARSLAPQQSKVIPFPRFRVQRRRRRRTDGRRSHCIRLLRPGGGRPEWFRGSWPLSIGQVLALLVRSYSGVRKD